MASSPQKLILPSFLRKTMKAYALKAHIRSVGCELHRVGRSRNWKLMADKGQLKKIIDIVEQSEEESWQWLAKYLRKHQEAYTMDELMFIAKQNSGISVNQLMSLTDCTIAQARKVIDELEFID